MTSIQVTTHHVPPTAPSEPAFVIQVTHLVGSYMLWIGTAERSGASAEQIMRSGHLARDWACAMPPNLALRTDVPPGTSLFRSSTDVALGMAQRLSRRFKKQVFLSVDIPASASMGPGAETQIAMEMEKALVKTVKELEK
ncbi:hypothetical protein DENSPDRAFT_781510 [Dentipellis sp. KUC8613]|nr:hypothetical protein DENSPDRAFT_781510 [Dentipellis sp. KUC8613]